MRRLSCRCFAGALKEMEAVVTRFARFLVPQIEYRVIFATDRLLLK